MFFMSDLIKISNYFGYDDQKEKLIEECRKYLESMSDEEIADIFVVVFQLFLSNPNIQNIANFKISRTLERIENGYYEPR